MTDVSEAVLCAMQNQPYRRWHKDTKYLNDVWKASSWESTVLECQMCLAPTAAV